MPGNSKDGWGKGCSSRIGRRHKNKFWKKKADIELLSDKHSDGIADDGGDEAEHMSIDILDEIEEEEISCELPRDLEDIVAEIVAEMDDSPRETDPVSIQIALNFK